jgi:hypothetical protein
LRAAKGKRGKHNDLVLDVLRDLSALPKDEAIRIPLKKVGRVSLTNLRSAISRAAKSRKIKIQTSSDSDYLYSWKIEGPRRFVVRKRERRAGHEAAAVPTFPYSAASETKVGYQ